MSEIYRSGQHKELIRVGNINAKSYHHLAVKMFARFQSFLWLKVLRVRGDELGEDSMSEAEFSLRFGNWRHRIGEILGWFENHLSEFDLQKLFAGLSKERDIFFGKSEPGDSTDQKNQTRENATSGMKEAGSHDAIKETDLGPKMPLKRYAEAMEIDPRTLKERIENHEIRKDPSSSKRKVSLSITDCASEIEIFPLRMSAKLKDSFSEHRSKRNKNSKP